MTEPSFAPSDRALLTLLVDWITEQPTQVLPDNLNDLVDAWISEQDG